MKIQTHFSSYVQKSVSMIGLLIGLVVAATQAQAQLPDVPFYRMYSPGPQTHFYTTSPQSVTAATYAGFHLELAIASVWSFGGNGRLPIYRLYNIPNGDHLYTIYAAEKDNALNHLGYIFEDVEGYAYQYPVPGAIPVYRCYRPYASATTFLWWTTPGHSADHLYTVDPSEVTYVTQHLNYKSDGISFYAFP